MEHSCYRCGQAVEQGVPFCPHCAAPQIRVILEEPLPAAAIPGQAVAGPESSAITDAPQVALPSSFPGGHLLKSGALAGLVASILVSVGLNPFVAIIGVGFLSVILYRQRIPRSTVTAATGARLGALGGFLLSFFSGLQTAIAWTIPGVREKLQQQLSQNLQKLVASGDPQVRAFAEQLKTPEGVTVLVIMGAIIFVLIGALSGAVAGKLLGRGRTN